MKSLPAVVLSAAVFASGCSAWDGLVLRSQGPDESQEQSAAPRLVGDLAAPFNMNPIVVESVGLVTGLKGTGSDPRPSSLRDSLVAEMHKRGVKSPNALLASKNASLVLVRAVLRPGIQKGDRFDVEVRLPPKSETTSLRGGYLLQTELKQLAVMSDWRVHEGAAYGVAEGAVLVDPSANEKSGPILAGRGRILGGGVALKSLAVGLALRKEHQSYGNAMAIESAVNRRFNLNEQGAKVGVAKAKTEKFIELRIHPRYKDNVPRYMAVVRSTALRESESELSVRLRSLERELHDPVTSFRSALRLEAIGRPAVEVLAQALQAPDAEVRFYAAEALAYLDDTRAAAPLGEAARNEPAFRVYALAALSLLDDFSAAEQLHELLKLPSAETRYGAFRALTAMDRKDPLVRGERLGGQFNYHVLDVGGQPMIHITRSRRAEIVLFGPDQRFSPPLALEAGNQILVTASVPGQVAVSKYSVSEPDQKRVISDRVDEVIRAIVELGGSYPDVVQALQQAKAAGALSSRLVVDALPEPGRTYDRVAETEPQKEGVSELQAAQPEAQGPSKEDHPGPIRAFFDRMTGRGS